MKKVITASVVVLLVAGTSLAAVGDVFQTQEWGLGLGSTVVFNTGQGQADTDQHLNLFNVQEAGNIGLGSHGQQSAVGGLFQTGLVSGNNPAGSAIQSIAMDGTGTSLFGQSQVISPGGSLVQSQGVGLLGKQDLLKSPAGDGVVQGENGFRLAMGQGGSTLCSDMCSASVLCGDQQSEIKGGPCSAGAVSTTMTAATGQTQQVN